LYIQNINNDLKETMGALSFDRLFGTGQEDQRKKNDT